MAIILGTIFKGIQAIIRIGLDWIIKQLPVYYTDIDKISLAKFFKVLDKKFIELYKVRLTKRVPYFFYFIATDMLFKMPGFDSSLIKKHAECILLKSMALRNNNKVMEFNADSMAKELRDYEEKSNKKTMTLNEFTNYIEITFNCIGTINPDKMKAGKAFSLFKEAKEKNKRLQNVHNSE